ncbi:hypothetical protein B0O99DRAFT_353294 [Bisporella sp. PMI_857]|nr:hypothetical protein B0O99DRAFT_353294 [Bisporella sp. PMI_857]
MAREKSQGRTKACDNCKRRKIKCDEHLPACSQCLDSNRQCSGAVGGMVFVNTSSTPGKPKGKVRGRAAARKKEVMHQPASYEATAQELHSQDLSLQKYAQDMRIKDSRPKPLFLPELTCTDALTQQCVAYWMHVSSCGGLSWVSALPAMLPGHRSTTIEKGMVAAAVAYYGNRTKNISAVMAGRQLYGRELQRQKKHMKMLQSTGKRPILEDVASALTLSFFELVDSTGPLGFLQHILGAQELIAMIGPEACASPEIFPLFRIVRGEMIYVSLRQRRASIFARTEWMTRPFVGQPRTAFDRMGDVFILLPDLFLRLDHLAPGDDGNALKKDAEILAAELDDINKILVVLNIEKEVEMIAYSQGFRRNHTILATQLYVSMLHHTACILVFSILCKLNPQTSEDTFALEAHCNGILEKGDQVLRMDVEGFFTAMVTPYLTVAIWGPLEAQRLAAKKVLESRTDTMHLEFCLAQLMVDSLQYGEMPAHAWGDAVTQRGIVHQSFGPFQSIQSSGKEIELITT